MSPSPSNDRPAPLRPVSQLVARPVEWLVPAWLPLAKLSILEGAPGLGKSLITLDLCARLSTGRPLPDGSPGREPCNCIILCSEGGAEDTIVPRLQAAGADLDRVFVHPPHADDLPEPLRLPSQVGALAALRYMIAALDARYMARDQPAPRAPDAPPAAGQEPPPRGPRPWLRFGNEELWTAYNPG